MMKILFAVSRERSASARFGRHAFMYEVLRSIGYHIVSYLFDDGTSVQVGGGVVGSCADDLHPARVGLVVRLCPHECRKKAVRNKIEKEGEDGSKYQV